MWNLIAKIVSRPTIADYLINRAQRTPYFHLEGYMNRWWLFNAYGSDLTLDDVKRGLDKKRRWLPSVRIHHILRKDQGRDLHDHPWNARTIILKGWYWETRLDDDGEEYEVKRQAGDTASLKYGEYHTITDVNQNGVWTMFITWDYIGTWGFLVDGKKVPWREYIDGGKA